MDGRLAQLVRAPRLHRGCRGFESLTAHHSSSIPPFCVRSIPMPSRLIVNADDFGLTPGINRAIAELHDAGVLTSSTLMANGPAFADAVALALDRPTLGVGCHIVLTDGTPISPPSSIPTLIGPDRRTFHPTLSS